MNQKQWDFLKNKFEAGQLGHAYLFSGKDVTSIEIFAKEFVRLVNCLSSQILPDGKLGNNKYNYCEGKTWEDKCQNCKMIERGVFPDLLTITSLQSESSTKNEKDMMSIEIEQLRQAQNFLSYKSFYGAFKAVIIHNAERLTFEAQNCFLKNLEEPRGETIIFLISSKPDMLLPTITSRCQEMKFFQIGEHQSSEDEQKILKELLNIMTSDLAVKFQYAKNVNLDEGNLNKILGILQRYFRDLLLLKIGVTLKTPVIESKNFTIGQIKKAIKLIGDISHQSNTTNVNSKLALEIVLLEL